MAAPTQTYGVTLPIMHGPQGYFNQSYTMLGQVKSNLMMLLQTTKGERRMNPEFGSGLWSVLGENITDNMAPVIENTIRKDIARWMSFVTVQSVDVANNQNNPNRLDVSVSFTVPCIGVTQTQTLQVAMNANNTP